MDGWACANMRDGGRLRRGDVGERVLQDAGAAGGDRDGAHPGAYCTTTSPPLLTCSRTSSFIQRRLCTAQSYPPGLAWLLTPAPGRRAQRDRHRLVPQTQGAGQYVTHHSAAEPAHGLQVLFRHRVRPLGFHVLLITPSALSHTPHPSDPAQNQA